MIGPDEERPTVLNRDGDGGGIGTANGTGATSSPFPGSSFPAPLPPNDEAPTRIGLPEEAPVTPPPPAFSAGGAFPPPAGEWAAVAPPPLPAAVPDRTVELESRQFGSSAPSTSSSDETEKPVVITEEDERRTPVRLGEDMSSVPFEGIGWVYIRSGERKGELHRFDKERTEIGRAVDCDLRLDDDYASSRHGAFVFDSHGWRLFDFASTNGTIVNGRLLGAQAPLPFELSDGDVVIIGDTEMVFKCIV